jgi:transcriptional regulator with PAS, ATPase and Fis domain
MPDLEKRVAEGAFRADLYFRINVVQIQLPPLKDRGNDVLELAALFMREAVQQVGMPAVEIDDRIRSYLLRYDWPGNIRELRNFIERAVILGAFPDEAERSPLTHEDAGGLSLAEIEKRHILSVLREVGGDREEAARRLGISRKTIDRKCVSWNG